MIAAGMSLASLSIGVVLSYRADAHPRNRETLEVAAGALLIVGFGLLGYLIQSWLGVS